MAGPGVGHEYAPVSSIHLNFGFHKLIKSPGPSLMVEGPQKPQLEAGIDLTTTLREMFSFSQTALAALLLMNYISSTYVKSPYSFQLTNNKAILFPRYNHN
jgi:hypothetical protein